MLKRNNIVFVLVGLLTLFSCRKEVSVDLPDYEPKLVVEGTIETGAPPVVILTQSVPYFSPISAETFSELFVRGAEVTVSNGSSSVVLDEICIEDLNDFQIALIAASSGITVEELKGLKYCIYTTFSFDMFGEEDTNYDLTIKHDGKTWTSTTYLPKAVPLNRTWFQVFEGEKDLGLMWAELSDPAGENNYYRWYARRINTYKEDEYDGKYTGQIKDANFYAPLGSAFDDKFFDGLTFEFNAIRGEMPNSTKPDDSGKESGFFKVGDTVVIKFTSIDNSAFKFLNVMEDQLATEGSPFASPSTLPGNIEGDEEALGAWIAYAPYFDTVICK